MAEREHRIVSVDGIKLQQEQPGLTNEVIIAFLRSL